ncbi:MAG: hypothetical protein WC337_06410, partial [Candidatus Muiribacteriota bacterium]
MRLLNDDTKSTVIPFVKAGSVTKTEKITRETKFKTEIVKTAGNNATNLNIGEIISVIPPSTLSKLGENDIRAIVNAFVSVIERQNSIFSAKSTELTTLREKSFELSQEANERILSGEYDEDTSWEIYNHELLAWGLKNKLSRDEINQFVQVRNNVVEISETGIQIKQYDGDDLINADISEDAFDDTDKDKIGAKIAKLNDINISAYNSELDFIVYGLYNMTEAIMDMDLGVDADRLIELTNNVNEIRGTATSAEFAIHGEIVKYEFERIADVMFGELLYKAFGANEAAFESIQTFMALLDGDDQAFQDMDAGLLTYARNSVNGLSNHLVIDTWTEDSVEYEELEVMATIFNYISKSTATGATKFTVVENMVAVLNTFWNQFLTDQNLFNTSIREDIATLFTYIFLFEIEKPLSLTENGEPSYAGNVIPKRLQTPITKERGGVTYTYNYRLLNAATGNLVGYGR